MFADKPFVRGSAILAATTFLSYLLGFVRDRLFARTFGASPALDAYNAAFIIPDLVLNIFVAGALTAAFTPVFGELLAKNKRDEAEETMSSILNGALITVIAVGLLGVIAAPWLSRLVAPGFDETTTILLVRLMRILFISPVIFAVSNTLGSALLTTKRFFFYGISPALYNLGIIAGTLLLAPYWGITGVVVGTIGGSFLHLLIRLIGMTGSNLRYRFSLTFSEHVKKIFVLMLPKMIGHPVEQLTLFGFTAIASTLGAGSIAVLNFARNFQSVPVGVIGIAAGLAIFPFFTEASAQNNKNEFRAHLKQSVFSVLLFTIAAAVLMWFLSEWLVGLLLGGGKFDQEAIARTATTLAVFTLAIPTESVSHVLVRAFYALKNTLIPVMFSIGGLLIAVVGGYLLTPSFGLQALPLAFFVGSLFKVAGLSAFLRPKMKRVFQESTIR